MKEPKKICNIQQDNLGIFKLESVLKGGIIFTSSADNSKILAEGNTAPNIISTFVLDDQLHIIKKSVVLYTQYYRLYCI